METQAPITVIERLQSALNQHEIDAFVACFAPNYDSEQPAHPDRKFTGNEQVRQNWSSIFNSIPDFHSELINRAVIGDSVWVEWDWHGTRDDNSSLHMRGVVIFIIRNDRIASARLYMEPVEVGAGIDAAVKSMGGE